MHLHYGLLADILVELAKSLASRGQLDEQHRTELNAAAKAALQVFGAAPLARISHTGRDLRSDRGGYTSTL
jgi:hypothetical protein